MSEILNKGCRTTRLSGDGLKEKELADSEYMDIGLQAVFNMGYTYAGLQEWTKAKSFYLKGLDILKRSSQEDLLNEIDICLGLASLYIETAEYELADDLLERVEKLQEKYEKKRGRKYAIQWYYANRSDLYKSQQAFESSHVYIDSAITKAKSLHPELQKHPLVGRYLVKKGDIFKEKASWSKALEVYQKALIQYSSGFHSENIYENPRLEDINLQHGGILRPLLAKPEALFLKYQEEKNVEDLEAAFETSLLLTEVVGELHKIYQADASSLFLQKRILPAHEIAIRIAKSAYEESGDRKYSEGIFKLMEASKARITQVISQSKTSKTRCRCPGFAPRSGEKNSIQNLCTETCGIR